MTRAPAGALARLARLGFSNPDAASREWELVGCLDDDPLLGNLAGSADPDLALRSLARLLAALGTAADELRATVRERPVVGRRLALVLGGSAALGEHLVSHPADWRELTEVGLEETRPSAAAIAATLRQAVDRATLRLAYRRLLLRLAARDLSLQLRVDDAAAELADLAAGAIEAALRVARGEIGPQADGCRLSVIGMGKCGGHELNYVSDVDVIFVAEPVDGVAEQPALAAATRLAAAMMRICSDHTSEGTLWPVDAALRPEGRSGPLVRTLASHLAYYRRWAKTWEFQALLKARPIAGDAALGQAYVDEVGPLVWSAADRPDFVADVQAMRRRVVEHIPRDQVDRQLKLGPGGLRDVEFAVQLLQLVHGRSDESLRSANTLQALESLTSGGYVGRDDGAVLAEAYRFLRTLEHRLQLSRLRRIHVMPQGTAELRVLGRSIGLVQEPARELTDHWRQHAREVRRLHEKLFYRPLLQSVAAIPAQAVRLTTSAAKDRLAALGYLDPEAALRHLEALTSGVSRRAAIQRTLLPVMLGWFAETPDPDGGLLGFRRLSDDLGTSHWYLRMLRDEGAAAERLARLLATSRYATDLLMRAPESVGLLAHDDDLRPRSREVLVGEAVAAAGRHADPVEAITAVRALRRHELFRVAAADIFGLLDVCEVSEALSSVAVMTLHGALAVASAAVEADRGEPLPTRLAVVAMGRLGGDELSYASDVDVLFVHEPVAGVGEAEAGEVASTVAAELRRLLALPGPDPVFTVDAALRPEGHQGPLVRTLASYRAYYQRWSKVWEAQALLRAAPVAGDVELGAEFMALVDSLRYPAEGLSAAEVAEVRRIKARVDAERLPRGADPATHVKLGPGGLGDVEWTAQLLQMRYAASHPSLRTTRTIDALAAAVSASLIGESDAAALTEAWRLATKVRNAATLVRGRTTDSLPAAGRDLAGVALLCGFGATGSGRLVEEYRRVTRRSRAAVDRTFWASS